MRKKISLIAAIGKNRAIGLNGQMPWHLPGELQHFKHTTMGKAILMGRKTWQAVGRALPGRQNIVISRNTDFLAPGAEVVSSLDAAIDIAHSAEIMVIGGGELYALALPRAQAMVLTLIDIEPQADTWFPAWDEQEWQQTQERLFAADDRNKLTYRIVEFERRSAMIKTAAELITEAQTRINCLDAASAMALYQEADNALILDVREASSVAESKLNDSTHISRGLIEMKVPKLCPDPATLILTHCGGGGRASLAALTLQKMGYTNVYAITAKFDDIKNMFG